MTSLLGYTTADKVKFQIEKFDAGASDAEIETLINHAEGLVTAMTKTKWETTIPQLIEMATTHLAALLLLQHDPSGLSSTSEAAFEGDILWALWLEEKTLLQDATVIEFIKTQRQ